MERVERSRIHRVRKKRKKKWTFRILTVFILLILGVGAYFGTQIWGAFANSGKKLSKSDLRKSQVEFQKAPFTVLLIGTDQRGHTANWRSDVLILAAVNPKTKSIKLVSIPRDVYTEIPNSGGVKTKINAAPYYGYKSGVGQVQNIRLAIEHVLHIPVDYYARINFQGFEDIVDALNGVDVNVKFPFHQAAIGGKMVYFEPGEHHLNGSEALAYVRMRHQDPKGDLGRNERQREVISALINKMASAEGVFNFGDVMKAVGNNFEMSFQATDIPALIELYRSIPQQNIETLQANVTFEKIPGVGDVDILNQAERDRINKIMSEQLGIKPQPGGTTGAGVGTDDSNQSNGQSTGESDSY
ncbi:LCP family protein [Thermoactinomyces daqus]|uniref:LCP family protein n=1 Tax=Thermoactinomyces daqus TaxID=1329516 RepID=A0A7W1X838_9BACL|nr:LCP family protein [Thermoactinomyces daqus]MBA4541792.1 LCP family protein [Thermoactinomyces daqus]